MKKFLTILLLSIIVISGVWFAWHFYWVFGEGVKAGQLNNFMKNFAIMGGMLYVMAYGAGPLSLDRARAAAAAASGAPAATKKRKN